MNSTLSPVMENRKGNVTLKQIASDLGVSHQLVSYALNDTGTVGADTRKRIKEAAERMGYRRNGSAMSMKSGRFGQVALLVSTDAERSYLPQTLWEGIHDALASHDTTLSLARLPDEKLETEGVAPKMLREWNCDGLLVDLTHRIPQRLMQMIHQHHLPAIWLNSQQESDCVYPNDWGASQSATRQLIELGHRRIAYLDVRDPDGPHEHFSVPARRDGYLKAMAAAKLEPMLWLDWRHENGPLAIPDELLIPRAQSELKKKSRPTAIVAYSPIEIEVLVMAAAHLGIAIPVALSLTTFESAPLILAGKPFTTWCVPEREIGKRAVQLLFRKIAAPDVALEPVVVPFESGVGKTTQIPTPV